MSNFGVSRIFIYTAKITFVLQVECGSFGLLILAFFLSLLFLCLWIEVPKDYNDYDWWASTQLSFCHGPKVNRVWRANHH